MPLQAQQIVTLAAQIAKTPGMIVQAGQFLNGVLQDLCNDYDLDVAKATLRFNFNSSGVTTPVPTPQGPWSPGFSPGFGPLPPPPAPVSLVGTGNGSGPYILPDDYLRTEVIDGKDNFFYVINGVPYPLIQVTLAEYHWLVQTPGFQSYPYYYTTDLARSPVTGAEGFVLGTSTLGGPDVLGPGSGTAENNPPFLFVWPPASGSYAAQLTYFRSMPDIPSAEQSASVPWFPNSEILIRGVAGRLMQISGDQRVDAYLGEDPERFPMGFKALLNAYLKNLKDREGAAVTVGLDRRRWGRPFDRLKNTKQIGW